MRRAMRLFAKERYKAALCAAAAPAFVFFVLCVVFPIPRQKLQRLPSTAVYSKDGELMKAFLSQDDFWRIRAELDDVSPFLRQAVLAFEDKWFYYHPGVNPVSLVRAAAANAKSREVVRGGSTITMQVARMMEPKRRNYLSKLIEVFRALQLELFFSKNEILEMYFNMAPYGGNIEGAAAAAHFYFGKSPASLSKSEAISLVAIPNSPTKLRPDRDFEAFKRRKEHVAYRLLKAGLIDENEFEEAKSDEKPRSRMTLPSTAPHFSLLAKTRLPSEANIVSGIDMRTQALCERTLARHLSPLLPLGITNGAVVVIENKTRMIRGMVGSRDFDDLLNQGQVNGAIAPRSPGSALKPFVYALALDEGIISPKLMVADVPVRYGSYSPANFDRKYRGGIPAEEALKLSLNVPAVNLTSRLKGKFYSFLKKGGITTLNRPSEHYGLPIVLGACEVSLLELTNLYSSISNGGVYRKYRISDGDPESAPAQIMSEGAAFIITDILADVRRPDLPNCWEFSVNMPKVAWKTGTSYGQRDAWSVGYNKDFTVGVWLGNFSGKEADMLVGAEVAAPLLFDVFNALSGGDEWFAKPDSVGIRKVCPLSGMPVSENCPDAVDEMYIYGISPAGKCDMHHKYYIDANSGKRVPKECAHGRNVEEKTFEVWPPGIATWMQREGYPIATVPEADESCSLKTGGPAPVILSPQSKTAYILNPGVPLEYQKILLEASVSNTVSKVFWFVNGELVASGSPQERRFITPVAGKHKIVCEDDSGGSSSVSINVVY
ncbi:MAG TPA: penicillin-binding protein 1C [bacterium]|nr:penicillin-binding protein 1C [bacterium]